MQVLEGAHASNEPGLIVQVVRAGTVFLLPVLLATASALALSERLCLAARAGSRLRAAVTATLTALAAAAVFAAWYPVHSWLFGGYVHDAGSEASPAAFLGRDGMLALAVALPVAVVLVQLERRRARAPRRLGAVARGLAAAGATVGLALVGLATVALGGSAAAGALGACPAGAPLRHFDVQAIDVKITLNRFGDNDPGGKMYVLSSRVSDVRAQEVSGTVATGLRDDAIQPLVIRANEGDCVEIAYTNRLRGRLRHPRRRPLLRRRVLRRPGRSQRVLGPCRRREHDVSLLRPRRPGARGRPPARPGPGQPAAVSHGLFGALVVEPKGSTCSPPTGHALASGWEAIIKPPTPLRAFREYALLWHEIGDERPTRRPTTRSGVPLPTIDSSPAPTAPARARSTIAPSHS